MIEFITDGDYIQFKDNHGLRERFKNTSNAFSWSVSDAGVINFFIDGTKYENVPLSDIYFDGVQCASHADFVSTIQGMFTNLSGGGGVSIQSATVTLTDAQIKALPTTPVTLVAAQGIGKGILPISCFGIMDATSGGYTNYTDSSFSIISAGSGYYSSPFQASNVLANDQVKEIFQFLIPQCVPGTGSFDGIIIGISSIDSTIENQALQISGNYLGTETNYTGGNAANTLKVTVYYTVVDL